jgi:hypothetical protein
MYSFLIAAVIINFLGRSAPQVSEKARQTILDLSRFLDKPIKVKFAGGREGT